MIVPLFEMEENIRSVNARQELFLPYEGDFDDDTIVEIEKDAKSYLDSTSKAPRIRSSVDIRILNGYFPHQFQPILPSKKSKSPKFKDMAPSDKSLQDAIEEIETLLLRNYNL